MRQRHLSILLGSGLADSAFAGLHQTQEELRRAGEMIYGCRCETCRRLLRGFWLALEAAPAPGSVAGLKAPRGCGRALVLVPSAWVHRAKGRQSNLAEQVGIHLHGKELRRDDRSTLVWLSNSVRRQNADEDKKWWSQIIRRRASARNRYGSHS